MAVGMLQAQDIHFSQFYASPLTLNPAMTGVMNGCYRINAIHRNQWRGYTKPFVTSSMAADKKFLENELLGDDFVGGGAMFFNDRSGDGNFTTTNIMVSGSYHKVLFDDHMFGIGVQAGYVQRRIDPTDLIFSAQYVGRDQGFDPSLPNNEGFSDPNRFGYLDLQTGLFWNGRFNETFSGFGGAALFHVAKPRESFFGGAQSRLPRRFVIHGGTRMDFHNDFDLIPNFIYMRQRGAKELNIGGSIEYEIPDLDALSSPFASFGMFYRNAHNSDALIFVGGIGFDYFNIGFSYDVTLSRLQPVNANFTNAFEISITYIGLCEPPILGDVEITCPRF